MRVGGWRGMAAMAVVTAVLSAAGCASTPLGAGRVAPGPRSAMANVSPGPQPTSAHRAGSPAPAASPALTITPGASASPPPGAGTGPLTSGGSTTGSAPAGT